ncbi:hypothetical protein LCD36_04670 [Saccharopolyspora sp. 6T]|uniref:hypothetical protein n=1 Tax=Saccharopolyspora sp. 6T TaxID=2877238 RepID=UPI001CD6C713|nr:hypothetical protein [Saccharopolyspora sp. 6T]MCA1185746.1 hypothetical protein [Saccharopolyspora sp. 6T]
MHPDFSTTVLDFGEVHELGDFATSELDTRMSLTKHVSADLDGVSVEYGLTFYTPDLADMVTTLPLESLRGLRDALTEVIGR